MYKTRYEDYIDIDKSLPIVFHKNLERSASYLPDEGNWHENLEVEYCVSGSGFVLLDGKRHEINPGSIVVVNSNVIHYTATENELVYSCLIIDSKYCESLGILTSKIRFEELFNDEEIRLIFKNLEGISGRKDDMIKNARIRKEVTELLILLCDNHISEKKESKSGFEGVRQTIKYISENYMNAITLDEVARNSLTDKYTLSRRFKNVTGQTIFEYIKRYRCKKAIECISSGKTVSEAARLCGFNNMSYFTKTVKRYMGHNPSYYKSTAD